MPYWDLKSYQQTEIIYDYTVEFCDKYIDKKSRTHDQMVQAARSGKQNIAEGCSQSKNKPKSEHYLLCIASASLKELLEDYQDYLRQRGLLLWDKDDPRAVQLRRLAYRSDRSDRSYRSDKSDRSDRSDKSYKSDKSDRSNKSYKSDESDRSDKSDRSDRSNKSYKTYKSYMGDPEPAANIMITLINQTTYLLDQQIKAVEQQMLEKGIELETQNQKILKSINQRKSREMDFWEMQKQAGNIRLINGQFKNISDLKSEDLDDLDLDEEWLSKEEVSALWKKFNKSE